MQTGQIGNIELYTNFCVVTSSFHKNQATKAVSYDDLANAFIEQRTRVKSLDYFESPILPLGTLHYKSEGQRSFKILTVRHISGLLDVTVKRGSSEDDNLKMHYPYIYFIWDVFLDGGRYRFRNVKIKASFYPPSANTNIYTIKFPNVFEHGDLCTGSYAFKDVGDNLFALSSLEDLILYGNHTYHIVHREDWIVNNGKIYETEKTWQESTLVKENTAVKLEKLIKTY